MNFAELVVIAVVALLVLGPERLPALARTIGGWVQKARDVSKQLQTEFEDEMKQDQLKQNIAKAEAAEKQDTE